jgi:hypothetical protein
MPLLVPLDEKSVVSTVDGVGDRVVHGYGLWAMSYTQSKQETPRITGGFPTIGTANSQQRIANSLLRYQIPKPIARLAFSETEQGAVP